MSMHGAEHPDTSTERPSRASERGVRASDAQREETAKVLRRHYAEGRLDKREYEERIDQCYAAKRVGELDELTVDLPREHSAARMREEIVARMRGISLRRRVAVGMIGLTLVVGTLGGAIALETHALPFPGIERGDGERADSRDAPNYTDAEGRDNGAALTVTRP